MPELILATHRRHCQRAPVTAEPRRRLRVAEQPREGRGDGVGVDRDEQRVSPSRSASRAHGRSDTTAGVAHASASHTLRGDESLEGIETYASAARYRSARRSSSTKPTTWHRAGELGLAEARRECVGQLRPGMLEHEPGVGDAAAQPLERLEEHVRVVDRVERARGQHDWPAVHAEPLPRRLARAGVGAVAVEVDAPLHELDAHPGGQPAGGRGELARVGEHEVGPAQRAARARLQPPRGAAAGPSPRRT